MGSPRNLVDLLWGVFSTFPSRPLLFYKQNGQYVSFTAEEVWYKTQSFAHSLKKLGVQSGDRVAIVSFNCPEWVIADLAILSLGGVVVPIYPTLSDSEMTYILQDSGSKVIVAQTEAHLHSISQIRSQCPDLKDCIGISNGEFLTLSQTILGDTEWRTVERTSLASIVYTSGTTGVPKGVMLSHDNFLINVEDALTVLPLSSNEKVLSFLPLSHVFERMAGYYTILAIKGQIYYAESVLSVSEDMRLAKPTVLISVPRLYEKIRVKILDNLSGLRKIIFQWGLSVGHARFVKKGKFVPFLWLAHLLVFSSLKRKMGGELRFFVAGGAPLGKELGEFFQSLGVLILEGYGQTESSPVIACNRPGRLKFGSVGLAMPHTETDITEDGELRVRGKNIMMGYWNKPEATCEVLDSDGWLYTGDIAKRDDEGFLFIVDRKKELIVLSNGKKIAPQYIEKVIGMCPAISQIVVVGEHRHFVSALIVPNFDVLLKIPAFRQFEGLSREELVYHPDIISYFQNQLDDIQIPLSGYERVKKFSLLSRELSQEAGEITVTLKPKRKVIVQNYAAIIESMYQ